MDPEAVFFKQKGDEGGIMNFTSIFRLSGVSKEDKNMHSGFAKLNALLKDKLGAGLGLILAGILVYAAITLVTIYNLLVSL